MRLCPIIFYVLLKAIPDEATDWSDKVEDVGKTTRLVMLQKINNAIEATPPGKVTKKRLIVIKGQFRHSSAIEQKFYYSDEALLTAMAYVDLNPVRASISKTPEESEFTSIKERIKPSFDLATAVRSYCEHGGFSDQLLDKTNPIAIRPLAKFIGGETLVNQSSGIHFDFNDYLELLDFTGRAIIQNKSGHIDNCLPSILQRLSIRPKTWFENVLNFEALYYRCFAPQFLLTG